MGPIIRVLVTADTSRAHERRGRGNVPPMEADRAQELLAAERERIKRALGRLGHQDDSEEADEFDPANRATDLYQDEFDAGMAEDPPHATRGRRAR